MESVALNVSLEDPPEKEMTLSVFGELVVPNGNLLRAEYHSDTLSI